MKITGYKLNGYNATYEKTTFDIKAGYNGDKNRVLEVTDIESGLTFIFETEERFKCIRPRRKSGIWRDPK